MPPVSTNTVNSHLSKLILVHSCMLTVLNQDQVPLLVEIAYVVTVYADDCSQSNGAGGSGASGRFVPPVSINAVSYHLSKLTFVHSSMTLVLDPE